jgi:5'-nucleotidase (lipoprotein e(P4) family)
MKNTYVLIFLLFTGCATTKQGQVPASPPATPITDAKLFASAYQQQAAEYRALCYQAFNLARLRLDQHMSISNPLPRALITDIDETILDNSRYQVHQSLMGRDYDSKSWAEWTARGEADTVPGAPSFLSYAASKGVQIFYITNRNESERTGTLANLQKFNLPNSDNAHLIMRKDVSSKEIRRQEVMKNYNILLYLGDNLADFHALYDVKGASNRLAATNQLLAEFGDKFIVLPNPAYGDWEGAMYNYGFTQQQKDSVLRSISKSY